MTSFQIKCIRSSFMYDMDIGSIYNYIVHENVVEYWEDVCWPERQWMPIYAFANAMQAGDITCLHHVVNVNDLPNEDDGD